MDLNQETRAVHKRTFMDFLDQDVGRGEYMDKITEMKRALKNRLLVDLTDLRNFDPVLTRRLMRQPGEYLQAFEDALEDTTRNSDAKYLKEGDEVHIGFEGQFGFHKLTPRELLSPFLGSLVCIEGIVTKCSLVRPKVVKSVHFCEATQLFISREYRDVTSVSGLPTGSTYPTKDDHGNLLVTEFGLSKYRDHQTIAIQEMPENSPPGQLPRSVEIIVEDDLVDACKPGDRVAVVGVYKAIPTSSKGSTSSTFRTAVVANNVSQLNKEIEAPVYSQLDMRNIKNIANQEKAWDILGESLAPSIYGHLWIKKALLLLLLGGREKNLENGTHLRGDINMLMMGDPSVAKSQILRAIMNIAPLAISTTGRGSSGVGLTAAVTQDQESGERRLEAGAMVLADRGIVCIDEFDKMSDLDRVAIHEVMEQQTVTIAKAGIHTTLNARCSVVAAANPIYGTYDHSLTPMKNIGLPDSLLSRFDLLFIVLDHMDPDVDRAISDHVLRMHRYRRPGDDGVVTLADGPMRQFDDEDDDMEDETSVYVRYDRLLHGDKRARRASSKRDPLTIKFLKKFIHYARDRKPELTDEATEHIATAYTEMRNQGMDPKDKGARQGTLPITARSLETMIRLATAHAKMKLRRQVLKEDAVAALEVMQFAIYHRELDEVDRKRKEAEEHEEHQVAGEQGGELKRPSPPKKKHRPSPSTAGKRTGAGTAEGSVSADTNDEAGGAGPAEDMQHEMAPSGGGAELLGSNGTEAEVPEEDEHMEAQDDDDSEPVISPERVERFREKFSRHVFDRRLDSLPVNDVAAEVNRLERQPYTQREIDVLLKQLALENRVMITDGTVHLI